jgi:hypothetical protein
MNTRLRPTGQNRRLYHTVIFVTVVVVLVALVVVCLTPLTPMGRTDLNGLNCYIKYGNASCPPIQSFNDDNDSRAFRNMFQGDPPTDGH